MKNFHLTKIITKFRDQAEHEMEEVLEAYYTSLVKELEYSRNKTTEIAVIYFGGGEKPLILSEGIDGGLNQKIDNMPIEVEFYELIGRV